jgi:cytochrome P450
MGSSMIDSMRSIALDARRGFNPLARPIKERDGFPVAPGAFPVLGHLPALAVDALGFMREAERRVGPLYYWNFGFDRWELTYSSRDSISLFRNKHTSSDNFRQAPGWREFFGESVMVHDGAMHQHMRSAMNGTFQPRGLAEAKVGEIVADLAERLVRRWTGREKVEVLADTREMALSVMFRLAGVEDEEIAGFRDHYEDLVMLFVNIPLKVRGSPYDRGMKARAWVDQKLGGVVARARAKGNVPGFLPSLIAARDDRGAGLTDEELVDNLRLLFLAGHETTGATMAWMVAYLADRPDVWRRLRDEARQASDIPRSPLDLRRFPYAEAVFRETLRMYPPVMQDARLAVTDFEIEGRTVKRGTLLNIPILRISRDPELYPDPDVFQPDRWLDRREPPTPLDLVQFASGPHFCLGYHLAWMEIVCLAVALGRALPADGPRLHGAFPKPRYLPTLHPSSSMRVSF